MDIQKRRHLSDQELDLYFGHKLTASQEQEILEHVAQCDYCAGRFASALPEREILTPPPDLSRRILAAADARPITRRRQQREFFYYTAKVVLSMAMALFLLIGGPLLKAPVLPHGTDSAYTGTEPAKSPSFYREYHQTQQKRQARRQKAQKQYEQEMQARYEKMQQTEKSDLHETLSEQGQRLRKFIGKYMP